MGKDLLVGLRGDRDMGLAGSGTGSAAGVNGAGFLYASSSPVLMPLISTNFRVDPGLRARRVAGGEFQQDPFRAREIEGRSARWVRLRG